MSGRRKSVTISTDGLRDYVTFPDGIRFILGTVSMARLVATCVAGRQSARRALNEFLASGEAMVALDLDKFEALVEPRRARWSSILSMQPEIRTRTTQEGALMPQDKLATTDQVTSLTQRISFVEDQVSQINKLAAARMPTERAVAGLRELAAGLHFYSPGDQSKNDAWNITAPPKVDEVTGASLSLPKEVTAPKVAAELPTMAGLTENANVAEGILSAVQDTNEKINALVTAGRKFNASQAKADLYRIASDVGTILTDADLAMPYVGTELGRLANEASRIHDLFVEAKV